MRTPSFRRPLLILGTVTALMVTAVAPAAAVPPEVEKGQVGHWEVPENEVTPTVNCRYGGSPDKLNKFVAKPPLVWWNDSDSNIDTEHGKVGWRIRIQQATNADNGPWTKTYETPIVKKTAYEDQPFEDADDAAPFTTRGIPWSRSGDKAYRVVYVLYWFNPDGTIRGSARHWITYYNLTGDANGEFVGYCNNKLIPLRFPDRAFVIDRPGAMRAGPVSIPGPPPRVPVRGTPDHRRDESMQPPGAPLPLDRYAVPIRHTAERDVTDTEEPSMGLQSIDD